MTTPSTEELTELLQKERPVGKPHRVWTGNDLDAAVNALPGLLAENERLKGEAINWAKAEERADTRAEAAETKLSALGGGKPVTHVRVDDLRQALADLSHVSEGEEGGLLPTPSSPSPPPTAGSGR